MSKVLSFYKRNQTVIWMMAFIAAFYGFLSVRPVPREQTPKTEPVAAKSSPLYMDDKQEDALKKSIEANPWVSLATLAVLVAGIWANISAASRLLRGQPVIPRTREAVSVDWGLKEIFFVFTLLYFAEALLLFIEYLFFHGQKLSEPVKDHLTVLNSLIRDIAVASYVIWFVRKKLAQPLGRIGLFATSLFRDIKTGLLSYVAIIPWLLALLTFLSWVTKFFSYEPPAQPVVELFFKPHSDQYMIFFSIFVAIVGPAIEEIFFRGFTYRGLRSKYGVRVAMIASSAIFALLHMNLMAFLPIFLLGFYLAYLYEKTGSLVPSMTVHMVHNLLMVAITLSIKAVIV